jgi:hypothetical protein
MIPWSQNDALKELINVFGLVVLVDVCPRKFGSNGVFWCEVSPKNFGTSTPTKALFFSLTKSPIKQSVFLLLRIFAKFST